jgi:hypothetical protein
VLTQARQKPGADEELIGHFMSRHREPAVDVPLTRGLRDAMRAADHAIAADERFEHLVPAEDLIREFTADCAADRQTDHVKVFMKQHGQGPVERICYFGVEFLSVKEPAEVAGIRLLPLDDPEIPETNPLLKRDKMITSYAVVRATGTNDVLIAARARKLAEHAFRVLRIALRQTSHGLNPEQLRFRLGTSYAFADHGGGWQRHTDSAYPLELSTDWTSVLATAVVSLPPTATRRSINEKALIAVGWLDRAVFTPDPLVATLYRFFALEALLGDTAEGLKNGPLALRQMILSRIATGAFRHPDDTFLAYKEVRSSAVHGGVSPVVTAEQASHFAWAVRDTLDQYLTVANEHGFTKRQDLLDLLDNYPGRDTLITWIREHCSDMWAEYLDKITADPASAEDEEQDPA